MKGTFGKALVCSAPQWGYWKVAVTPERAVSGWPTHLLGSGFGVPGTK